MEQEGLATGIRRAAFYYRFYTNVSAERSSARLF